MHPYFPFMKNGATKREGACETRQAQLSLAVQSVGESNLVTNKGLLKLLLCFLDHATPLFEPEPVTPLTTIFGPSLQTVTADSHINESYLPY